MGVLIFILFVICGYLLYQQVKLERRLNEKNKEHKKALADAGNAMVGALKIAFDNIKKLNQSQDRMKKEIKEHASRIKQFSSPNQVVISKNKNVYRKHIDREVESE
jgi:hypothetical protein